MYYDYYQIKPSVKKVFVVPSSVNADIKSDEVNIKSDNNSAAYANKFKKAKGSKQVWVLKTNH